MHENAVGNVGRRGKWRRRWLANDWMAALEAEIQLSLKGA
jgi:hypothetical protein